MAGDSETDGEQRSDQAALTLFATGVTLLGVIVSIAITVGFGVPGPVWVRVVVAVGVAVSLVAAIKLLSRSRRGPLTRLANWIVGAPDP